MIPLWKLRREWARLKQQLRAIPEAFSEPAARRRHDASFERGFTCHDGAVEQREKIALFLLFQPDGIAQSTLETCAHLVAKGYAPFLVSNAPLSEQDRARLVPHAWRMMERPNFGYDFGGYRDGIRQLFRWKIAPERLLVLNDSIWFPTVKNEELLPFLETVSEGIRGTILRERGSVRFLESYCYSIPRSTFQSPVFSQFWDGLKITSNKYKVIRRGERGFSEAMSTGGIPLVPAFPYAVFLETLAAQTDDFLEKTLLYTAHIYDENETRRQALLAARETEDWRDKALAHIRTTIPREQPYSAYPYAMVQLFNYPILKKSNDRVAQLWRATYLRAVDAGDLPAPPAPVLAELRDTAAIDGMT